MVIDSITRRDIEAHRLAHTWGFFLTAVHHPVSPCPRPACGGSVLSLGDGVRCLLCARGNGDAGKTALGREAEMVGLMAATPGSYHSLRTAVSE